MKAFFITTETNETPKYPESLACINGNEVKHYIFHHRGDRRNVEHLPQPALDRIIFETAVKFSPDVIVYLGSCGGNIPTANVFTRLNAEIAPTVLMCSDAADEASPWWPLLREYDKRNCFSVVVGIDGNRNWEFSDRHITLLTPIDPARYPAPPIPHIDRSIVFGFAGNMGSDRTMKAGKVVGRRPLINEMMTFGLQCRQRDDTFDKTKPHSKSYQDCCDYMAQTRIMPNFCETGSYERTHVKGRVVEAGLAGCMLLEQTNSPANHWFELGTDYLEFETVADVRKMVEHYRDRPDETQAFGDRLRAKMMAEHTPQMFWGQIMTKLGLPRDIRTV